MSMISNFGNLSQYTGDNTAQQRANNSGSTQTTEALRESFLQPNNVSTDSQDGGTIAGATNKGVGNGTNMFKRTPTQGGILGTQDIQSYGSQSNAQPMNVNPMLNNSIGSLGQNNTGGMGLSSGLGNIPMAQKYNGLGNIWHNPQGNNYNIIGGVELV